MTANICFTASASVRSQLTNRSGGCAGPVRAVPHASLVRERWRHRKPPSFPVAPVTSTVVWLSGGIFGDPAVINRLADNLRIDLGDHLGRQINRNICG